MSSKWVWRESLTFLTTAPMQLSTCAILGNKLCVSLVAAAKGGLRVQQLERHYWLSIGRLQYPYQGYGIIMTLEHKTCRRLNSKSWRCRTAKIVPLPQSISPACIISECFPWSRPIKCTTAHKLLPLKSATLLQAVFETAGRCFV